MFVSTTFATVAGGLDAFTGIGYNTWVIVYNILVFLYHSSVYGLAENEVKHIFMKITILETYYLY